MRLRRIFFDHIPKAGGSAVHEYFHRASEGDIAPLQRYVPASDALLRYHRPAVLSGHFNFHPNQQLPPDRCSITLLRDPVDRALSFYYFCRNDARMIPGEPESRLRAPTEMTLEEYVFSESPEVLRWIANAQTHHFLALAYDGYSELSQDDKLARAIAGLNRFDAWGTYGEVDRFQQTIATQYGNVGGFKRINVTSTRKDVDQLPTHVRKRLIDLNSLDYALYEHAARNFSVEKLRLAIDQAPDLAVPYSYQALIGNGINDQSVLEFDVSVEGVLNGQGELFNGEGMTITITGIASEHVPDTVFGVQIRDHLGLIYRQQSDWLGRRNTLIAGRRFTASFSLNNLLAPGVYVVDAYAKHRQPDYDRYAIFQPAARSFSVINGTLGPRYEGSINLMAGFSLTHARQENPTCD